MLSIPFSLYGGHYPILPSFHSLTGLNFLQLKDFETFVLRIAVYLLIHYVIAIFMRGSVISTCMTRTIDNTIQHSFIVIAVFLKIRSEGIMSE